MYTVSILAFYAVSVIKSVTKWT